MRVVFIIISIILLSSCGDDMPPNIGYSTGDFWVGNFRNNSFPAKAFANDKVYCSSLLINYDTSNHFYCLNLKTGKVDWEAHVKEWASQPPIICDSFIYYCSYVGDIYKFDKDGHKVWYLNLQKPYAGHSINPLNGNLIVSTVVSGLREIDCKEGKIIDSVGFGKMDVPLPVFQHDTVFQVIDDTIFCKNFSTKSLLWKKKTGFNIDKIFLNNKHIFYFDDSKSLNCLDYQTGELFWQSDSVFPTQPFAPMLEFESGKILSLFSNFNEITVIDPKTGSIQQRSSFQNLQKDRFLLPSTHNYTVMSPNNRMYEVQVISSLIYAPNEVGISVSEKALPQPPKN